MALMEGFLTKSPPKSMEDFIQLKRWKRRYFELKQIDDKYILEYRACKASKTVKGVIDLNQIEYLVNNFPYVGQRKNLFAIKIKDNLRIRIFYFDAKFSNEYKEWIKVIISILNMIPSTMNIDLAKELVLAGFFVKSYLKNEDEYCEMLVNSLLIYIPKKLSNTSPVVRPVSQKVRDHSDQREESCLPTRCTSTLSSNSSSESASDNDKTNYYNVESSKKKDNNYLDSKNLEFQPSMAKPNTNSTPALESVKYLSIDPSHTEALYKLNKRLDSHT